MRTLKFNIPDNIDISSEQILMLIATSLYEKGKLSLGQAAELAGLTKKAFAEIMGNYDVSIFNTPSSELSSDIANA